MSVMRSALLLASTNGWLREHATKYKFVRSSVSRFMPGETLEDALRASETLRTKGIGGVLTHLGENVRDPAEAQWVTDHYLGVLAETRGEIASPEISVKPTQLGLDLSPDLCFENLRKLVEAERRERTLWIDMEASNYVDATLELYRRALKIAPNVGVCLQAYLYRTKKDWQSLMPLKPSIRLVKGAYKEPPEIAFPKKSDVDQNYFLLAEEMLRAQSSGQCSRAAFGTHDLAMIRRLSEFSKSQDWPKQHLEIQMLYGIQRAEQERLAQAGHRSMVLVAYGTYWYPWFVRRLAERPANVWFLARNLLS
jgi:proline dehydrogenase